MNDAKCSYNWEAECLSLKEELMHLKRRLDEGDKIICALRKENETLKTAYDEQQDALIRYEGQIEAFQFVIERGR